MDPKIVLDTNVLIAGLMSPRGASHALLQRVGSGTFELMLSVPVVLEYEAVAKAHARDLGLTFAEIEDVVDYLCKVGHHREIYYMWRPFLRDPMDDMLLELAVESEAPLIVTHNLRDFEGVESFGIEAIPPGMFLRRYKMIEAKQ